MRGSQHSFAVPGEDARPWLLERQNGLARGTLFRLAADSHFSGRTMLNGVQSGFNARLIYWGFSAYRVAFGPNQVDLFVRGDDGVDIGASRQRWKLRMAAQ